MKRSHDCQPMPTHHSQQPSIDRLNPFSYRHLGVGSTNDRHTLLSQPQKIGHYSRDANEICSSGIQCLKYLSDATECPMDLTVGIDQVTRKKQDETKVRKLDNLLKWIRSQVKGDQLAFDIVCFRGLLTALMVTPYENKEGWKIMATKYKNTIYLWQEDTEEKKEKVGSETKESLDVCSWGYKFEQYMTTDDPSKKPVTDVPVDENEEFCCMMSTKIGNIKILYGAEIDCIASKKRLTEEDVMGLQSLENFVELKTCRKATQPKQHQNFQRFKLIKWWAQSFLVGVPKVICGWKDDSGIVHEIEEFPTLKIPGKCVGQWKGNNCVYFLRDALNFIKSRVSKDDAKNVYQFEWKPRGDVTVQDLGNCNEYSVVPQWYTANGILQSETYK